MIDAFRLRPFEDDGFLSVAGDRLLLDGADLTELAERFGTPLFVYSESRLRRNARQPDPGVSPPSPAHHGLLREQGLRQPLGPAPDRRGGRRRGGQLGRRAAQGPPCRHSGRAHGLQRRRQEPGRDCRRARSADQGDQRRFGVRAGAHRGGRAGAERPRQCRAAGVPDVEGGTPPASRPARPARSSA